MNDYKTSESMRKAIKKYEENNKEKKQYRNKKAATKNFILKTARDEDLVLVETWLEERRK